MAPRLSICALLVISSLAIASSSIANPHRLAKRSVWDDMKDFFNNVKDKLGDITDRITDFTAEQFQDFKDRLKSMSKVDMQATLDKMRAKYDTLSDKASIQGERLKESMSELTQNLQTSGAVSVRSTFVAASGLALLLIILLQ